MKKTVPVQLLEGMGGKEAKKIARLELEDGMIYLLGSFGAAIAKLKVSSIDDAKVRQGFVSAGLFKKEKAAQVMDLIYTTKSGEKKTLTFLPGSEAAANLFCASIHAAKAEAVLPTIPTQVDYAKAREEREERLKQRQQDFADVLKEIPRVEIGLDGEKGTARSVEDFVNGLKIKSITARASYSMLGDYVVVDIETGGLSVRDPILEVSAIRFDAYEPTEIFTTLLDPGRHIDEEASAVNGITDDMVEGKPTIWQIMPSLREFVGSSPIVGHNIAFDLKFLYRYGFDLQPGQKVYDTWKLSRKAFPEDSIKDYKLTTIMEKCDLPFPDAHRSAADCLAAGVLFRALAQHLAES